MKTTKFYLMAILFFIFMNTNNLLAQYNPKPLLAVLHVDTQGINLTPEQMGNLLRMEVEKLDMYEVMDRYDVAFMISKHNLNLTNCYGKICLVETGKLIKANKMLSGTVELFGETIFLTLRLIDVDKETIEKTQTREFLNLQNELQPMVSIVLKEMFGKPVDQLQIDKLTKKYNLESAVNNPQTEKINLSGPRVGITMFTGNTATIMKRPTSQGGFDVYPVMFQFGYQFEAQYLNQGDFQALFEFLPTITGMDQGKLIPAIAIMNGLRYNRWGLEFAFGPLFNISRTARGYYENEVWHLEGDWPYGQPNPNEVITQMDSRGTLSLGTSFVFGIGKTFRSGKLNMPVNFFAIPHREGLRLGLSFGYNAKK